MQTEEPCPINCPESLLIRKNSMATSIFNKKKLSNSVYSVRRKTIDQGHKMVPKHAHRVMKKHVDSSENLNRSPDQLPSHLVMHKSIKTNVQSPDESQVMSSQITIKRSETGIKS